MKIYIVDEEEYSGGGGDFPNASRTILRSVFRR
jgi:hypothetical protein